MLPNHGKMCTQQCWNLFLASLLLLCTMYDTVCVNSSFLLFKRSPNCSRDDLDLTAENMFSVKEFLITGTQFLRTISNLALLIRLKCMYRLN